jgi:antirestriction protein ArdC
MRNSSENSSGRNTLYQGVTDRIIRELEEGRVPWVQPWEDASCELGLPRNAVTGRSYSGINVLILWDAVIVRGFAAQQWLTFRQALAAGGNVRKGERGTTICYADRFIPRDERQRAAETGEDPAAIPFLKRFTVFNVEQCENLPETAANPQPSLREAEIVRKHPAWAAESSISARRRRYQAA